MIPSGATLDEGPRGPSGPARPENSFFWLVAPSEVHRGMGGQMPLGDGVHPDSERPAVANGGERPPAALSIRAVIRGTYARLSACPFS
ncbi:hypothetical protein GCM10009661_67090 [Catellatospora chokoriensis]|uniref:Uncharacterized protein n=1 Tax=Catellatospora chokoriensis TaxID=310353 RepID=A0A8J3NNV9_9ACTN|nr:hypothetical protein Cch02nite_08440 [Catellatospora chokoriensis]